MKMGYIVVTILAAVVTGYAASNDFTRPDWLMENMKRLNIPQTWLRTLGVLKGAGAVGLLAGLMMPKTGIVSGVCLVIFFLGAIVFTLRARFFAHLTYPLVWLVLVTASLALRLMTV
jgi:DoxX-like family